jgi:hypothetical protein
VTKVDSALLTLVSEALADYADDEQTFWDTLDGETDVMGLVGKLIQQSVETDAQIAMIDGLVETYRQRKSSLQGRKEAYKRALMTVLRSTNQAKVPHALGTVSLRKGTESVLVTNIEEVPTQLCKITKAPDKTAIKAQLKAGETIDGVELVTSPETVSIRIK